MIIGIGKVVGRAYFVAKRPIVRTCRRDCFILPTKLETCKPISGLQQKYYQCMSWNKDRERNQFLYIYAAWPAQHSGLYLPKELQLKYLFDFVRNWLSVTHLHKFFTMTYCLLIPSLPSGFPNAFLIFCLLLFWNILVFFEIVILFCQPPLNKAS